MGDLELTLTWLGIDCYLDVFLEAGFDSWETLLEITENDLDILNVSLGHRRKLQREIATTKRLARDPVFVNPLYKNEPHPTNTLKGISSSSTDVQQGGPPTKRDYRHHPKPDSKAPERPKSAYVLFSNHMREQLKSQNLSFTDLSKEVGEKWQRLTRDEKEEWKSKGAVPWETYKANLAEYQKTDDFREYQRYLAEFKATQAAKNPQRGASSTIQSPVSAARGNTRFSSKPHRMVASPTGQAISERKDSKVASKRLKRDEDIWAQAPDLVTPPSRVRQACESCRSRKIKCYGEQPMCRHCRELGVECYYASGRRDRTRRQEDEIWQKLNAYTDLLVKVLPQVDDDDRRAIQNAMHMPPRNEPATEPHKEPVRHESRSDSCDDGGGSDISGAGSMGSADHINQDDSMQQRFAHHVEPFKGQSSESKWTEKLNKELLPKPKAHMARARDMDQGFAPHTYSEDMDTAVVGHQIDPFSLPVKSTADSLVNAYFSTIHLSFPLLDKLDFVSQYDQLYSSMDPEGFRNRTFIATLQLVFAIAAVHAHLVQADWTGDARDHMLYFSQARVLAVDTGVLNDDCYLGQVQVFGLGGIYLLVTNQLNRAWNLSGLAVRSAQAMGLHLRDVSASVATETKVLHAYNWFALMTLESMLTLMTGRPSMINLRDCNVTVPKPSAEVGSGTTNTPLSEYSYQRSAKSSTRGPSTSSMSDSGQHSFVNTVMEHETTRTATIFFVHYVELCTLVKEAVGELYRPGIRQKKWPGIQSRIEDFDSRLFEWKNGVNPPLDNAVSPTNSDPETESCRMALHILFHSTRVVINRPCLCRNVERTQDSLDSSKKGLVSAATKCVESARAAVSLILYKPESTFLHEGTMWWMLLHHLKRALTVLLLELAFRAEHMPSSAGEILAEAKAAVNWLNHLGNSSSDARNTYSSMRRLLRLAAERIGGDTSDIPTSSEEEEAAAAQPPHQQSPYAYHDNPNQNAFPPLGLYDGTMAQGQGLPYADLTEWSEFDQFGFLRAEGGAGSLFPAGSDARMSG